MSLPDNDLDPLPSESTGLPKVDKPQAGTTHTPFATILERLSPPHIVTIGRVIRTTAVELLLEQDFFRSLSRGDLWMSVGLCDLNTGVVVDEALKGQNFFPGNPPVSGLSANGIRVLKFVFNTHSMRVKQNGSYRLFYGVTFPDPRGFKGSLTLRSSGFVTKDCPNFSKYS